MLTSTSRAPGTPLASSGSGFRADVQGLRAVAVGVVVLSHMGLEAFAGGFVGVDVFFVISGFLITGLLVKEAQQSGSVSLLRFYARRGRRILPASVLVLVVTCLSALVLLGRVRAEETLRDSVWAALFSANWQHALNGSDYFSSALPPSPLQHFWSLAVEEQFYVVWPAVVGVVLFGVGRRRRRARPGGGSSRRRAALVAVLCGVGVVSLWHSVDHTGAEPAAAYFSSLTRAWELAAGALLALVGHVVRRAPGTVLTGAGWAGLLGIALSVALIDESTPFPGVAALLPVVSTALVIAGGVRGLRGAGRPLSWRPVQWLGDRSYSLYLWHWPVLVIAESYRGSPLTVAQSAYLIAGALVLSDLSYRFVERPFRDGGRAIRSHRAVLLWPVSVCLPVIIAVIGITALRAGPEIVPRDIGFASAASSESGVTDLEPTGAPDPTASLPAGDPVADAVSAAVGTAADEAVPSTVTPALPVARQDNWSRDLGDECVAGPGRTTHRLCVQGDAAGDRTVVLFGDSHAGMWMPAFRGFASGSGWNVVPVVKYGCTAADVVLWRAREGGRQEDCVRWRTWAMQEIARLEADVVIVSQRGAFSLAAPEGEQMPREQSPQAYQTGMASTISQLKRTSERVIVFSDVPYTSDDPVGCLDAPRATLKGCSFPRDDQSRLASTLNEAAARASGGEYVDLTPWFCSAGTCPLVVNRLVVYFDPGHITRTYAVQLSERLRASLRLT